MRRHLWVQAPLRVRVDGVDYRAAEWSLSGVAIDNLASTDASIGQAVKLHLDLPYQGFGISFDAAGEIESIAPESNRAIIGFRNLGPRERDLLSHFIDQLVRGNMATVDETIHRLGAPLAAAELVAAAPPAATAKPRHHGPLRTLLMTTAYAAAGAFSIGYLASLVYSNLFWMEAPASSISAPVETLVALGDGIVTWNTPKPGDKVKAGDIVLEQADNVLEREIEQAEIAVRERESKRDFLNRKLDIEKKRLSMLAGVSNLKSTRGQAEVSSLQAKLQSAQRELRRLPANAVGPLAQVRQRIVGLQQAISLKEVELSGQANLNKGTNQGSFEVVGQTVVGELETLAAQIEMADADVSAAMQRHQSYLNQRDRLSIRAPFDGILRQLPHADKAIARKGDVVAVIERSSERTVTAYLRQDQLLRVQLGAQALVHVPATRQTFKGKVTEIEPARGVHKDQSAHGSRNATQRAEDGMAAVRLTLTGDLRPDDVGIYKDGLPAVTTIGLSLIPKPYAAPERPAKIGSVQPSIAPIAQVETATAATATTETGSWLSRRVSSAMGYLSGAARTRTAN